MPLKVRCGFGKDIRVESKFNKKSSNRMFGASMKVVGAAELVRVHAKLASDGSQP